MELDRLWFDTPTALFVNKVNKYPGGNTLSAFVHHEVNVSDLNMLEQITHKEPQKLLRQARRRNRGKFQYFSTEIEKVTANSRGSGVGQNANYRGIFKMMFDETVPASTKAIVILGPIGKTTVGPR